MRKSVQAFSVLAGAMVAIVSVPMISPNAASAAPADIVISELMYHPIDAAPIEFLEVANRGTTAQSIAGWCLTTGIDFCFPAGTTLAAGQRTVVTDNLALFAPVYGNAVTPAGQYLGALSNGGETIDLRDANGIVIDTVAYDDELGWPAAPDGNGPSLELKDLNSDNNVATSWGTSVAFAGHTAGLTNSLEGLVLPEISETTANPLRPNPSQPITVSARISGATAADLTWLIDFGATQSAPMNDGPQSVGGAGDGVWSAVIPGQAAGDLVRYRVDAFGAAGNSSFPDAGDTIDYAGVVVLNPAVSTNLPVLEWFMEDAVHDDLIANHRFDDFQGEAVIAYNGIVYDGVLMNIRGNSSRLETKVNWKVEFPSGHLFDMPGLLDRPVDEFNLQRGNFPEDELAWQTAREAGAPALEFFKVRTQRNGAFYSVASVAGTYDNVWRNALGRSDWALYKAEAGRGRSRGSAAELQASGDWDKKEGEDDDWTDIHELTTVLDAPPSEAQKAWMWENLNIPAMINYAATVAIVRHADSSWYNYYATRDTNGTGRWEMLFWDMDTLFTTNTQDGDGDFLTPADNQQKFMIALMNYPEFRQMYMRRFRTLIDQKLATNSYENQVQTSFARYSADFNLDRAMWGGRTLARYNEILTTGLADRRRVVAANQGPDGSGLIPPSPTGNRPVEISRVEHAPAAGSEYIAIRNNSATESLDLSQWTVSGALSVSIPGGTVLLPGATGYLVGNDAAFRATNGATRFVIDEFVGALPDAGGSLTLTTATGVVVDTAPFPNGGGEPTDVEYFAPGASWRYLDTAAPVGWAGPTFNDSSWRQGPAQFGFGDGDEATVVSSTPLTTYYRRTFNVADANAVSTLTASLVADDGAVVYLNGVEVARDNMPAGGVTAVTPALSSRIGADENAARTFALPPSALVTGANVLAVEVHNRWYNSSDLSFSLGLSGVVSGGGAQPPGQVVAAGSVWRFFDAGTTPAGWTTNAFADGSWRLGSAEFGFGEGDEATLVNTAVLTSYYRQTFTVADPSVVTQLVASLDADDGAVIYINGVEVARDNMPAGTVTALTAASSSRFGVDEGVMRTFTLPVSSLRPGSNVIAVEIHNRWYNSSDLSFDLSLRAD